MDNGISTRLSSAELRKFGFTVGGAFLALAAIGRLGAGNATITTLVTGSIGGALAVCGGIAPSILRPVYSAWMKLSKVLSRITTPVFLAVVYFLIFTPVGLFRRMIGKDALDRPLIAGSYWKTRAKRQSDDMDRLF